MSEDRPVGRKIRDTEDNVYAFELPEDVDANSITDILLSATQGITKLVGYRLHGEVYRTPTNEPIGAAACRFNSPLWKRLDLYDKDTNQLVLTQQEFGEMMQQILEREREQRINRPRATWKGFPVKSDGHGPYIERELACSGRNCSNVIKGIQRLSRDEEGNITRTQQFSPNDYRVTRAKHRSKNYLCPDCAPRSIPVGATTAPESPVEPISIETSQIVPSVFNVPSESLSVSQNTISTPQVSPDVWDKLLNMSAPDSEVGAEYLKGVLHGVLMMREALKE